MSVKTEIAWCDHTYSPWSGCTRVSPGCDRCYAATLSKRFAATFGSWEPGAPRKRASAATLRQPLLWHRAAAAAGVRRRVFPSLCDPFDNQAPGDWRRDLFDLIRMTPALDYLLLTKRPQNVARMLPPDWRSGYRNVWLGVSVENQAEADRRIPAITSIPAVVRFLSVEPLLERVRLDLRGIAWVIVGGESGAGARPMLPAWDRDVRDQCREAGTPLFMKQTGTNRAHWPGVTGKGDDPAEWPRDVRVQKFPA